MSIVSDSIPLPPFVKSRDPSCLVLRNPCLLLYVRDFGKKRDEKGEGRIEKTGEEAKHRLQIDTPRMIEVVVNDRLGKKVRVKCLGEDTVGDFKKVLSLQIGTQPNKIVLQKGGSVLKDHISLEDYEVHDETNLELYYL